MMNIALLFVCAFFFNFCSITVSEKDISKDRFSAEWKYFIAPQCAHSNIFLSPHILFHNQLFFAEQQIILTKLSESHAD